MKKIKTLEEVHKELKAAGFEFLGFRIICDCYHYYWARPLGNGKYQLAISDGWFGDYTPEFHEVTEEDLQRVKKKIREFHEWR